MTADEIRQGIEQLVPIAGRNHLIETDRYSIIDDCYNANPVSMKSSLSVLSGADTRTVAILGDMFELGNSEKEMHYETGAFAADAGINVLICIGGLSAETARGAREASSGSDMEVLHYDTKEDFLNEAGQILHKNDTILVKASHAMDFAKIVEELQK